MQTILRSHYLDILKVLKGKNLIKVATGVRRCVTAPYIKGHKLRKIIRTY